MNNNDKVISAAKESRDNCRIFTFGIGSGCDENLVKDVAKAGRGSYNIVSDQETNLKSLIIKALGNSSQPSLKDCFFSFGGSYEEKFIDESEVFRNQLIQRTILVDKESFNEIKAKFSSAEDPIT